METIKLLPEDFAELERLATILISDYPLVMKADTKFKEYFEKKGQNIFKIGAVLGYKGKVIYEIKKSLIISKRSLQRFQYNIGQIPKHYATNTNNSSVAYRKLNDELIRIVNKLDKQVITENFQSQGSKKKSKIIEVFEKTQWYVYERFIHTIGRKLMIFGEEKNNKISITMISPVGGMHEWVGYAYFDYSKKFLIINSYNSDEENSLPTNFLIRVDDSSKDITLCAGHMTFANQDHHNVITKTILLAKIPKEKVPDIKEMTLPDAKKEIPNSIFRFLFERSLNRLTSPHSKIISSEATLGKWHEENVIEKRRNRNDNLKGKYDIYYRKSYTNQNLIRDELIIKEGINGDLVAYYFHKVDPKSDKAFVWKGSITDSPITRAVFINLQGPTLRGNISTIFLILNMPAGERNFNLLTGIISSVRDNYDGSLAMLIAAIKTNQQIAEKLQEEKLNNFFDAFFLQSLIMPPISIIASFDDLDLSLAEGEKTKSLVKQQLNS